MGCILNGTTLHSLVFTITKTQNNMKKINVIIAVILGVVMLSSCVSMKSCHRNSGLYCQIENQNTKTLGGIGQPR